MLRYKVYFSVFFLIGDYCVMSRFSHNLHFDGGSLLVVSLFAHNLHYNFNGEVTVVQNLFFL